MLNDFAMSSFVTPFLCFAGTKASAAGGAPVYLDLAYLPSGCASTTIDVEFFQRLRSSCYIVSSDGPLKESVMRPILDALLEGKTAWPDVQVCNLEPIYIYTMSEHGIYCVYSSVYTVYKQMYGVSCHIVKYRQ